MKDQTRDKMKLLLLIIVIAAILAGTVVLFIQIRRVQERAQAVSEQQEKSSSVQISPAAPKLTAAPSAAEPTPAVKTPSPTPEATPKVTPEEVQERAFLTSIEDVPAGTILREAEVDFGNPEQYFQSYEISDAVFDRIYGDDKSYKTYCTVPREDLRYIKVLHRGFDGEIHVGELIVHQLLAGDMCEIFRELFENDYQIERMLLVDEYQADDEASIAANNTSAFNFRAVTGGTTLSLHGMGCAIDINPINNPYIMYDEYGNAYWEDPDAELYLDRNAPDAAERHMINHEDLCYRLFTEHGFSWGGDWANPADYQHFEKAVAYYSS